MDPQALCYNGVVVYAHRWNRSQQPRPRKFRQDGEAWTGRLKLHALACSAVR